MTFKKLIGYAIIIAFFLGLFCAIGVSLGFMAAVIIFTVSIVCTALLIWAIGLTVKD